MLILASQSASRTTMLAAAGVPFTAEPAYADEAALKAAMAGRHPRDVADALAELKALKVSARHPGHLVLGSDSLAVLDDGTILDKPTSREEAREHLTRMSGKRHDLVSAAVIAENGQPVWRMVDKAKMFVRPLSPAFIETYLDAEWPEISGCVGCYRIEGPGAQLFSRIDGSQFTVLGMPLLPVLDYLRVRQVLPA
ncbi:nucleoside triphosphate pyrophosphatase [Sphingomonas endophytica]|uniref:Nucleoside triphosphate pyrophosphatase n=1 Tax=Sphingomonas endophytica TaxID=869719 RepID=A0A7X0JCR4_9SPHN|nr:nucleoside triphosphate pyrophosphatase [Sphingomonas endophytica]MBB5726440.1 septum formation protein [Sphingomonas endophytica]MBB6504840.1 septum formation protein [Sphingomonas endophytica]